MPYRWIWREKPPWYFTAIFFLMMLEFALGWILFATLPKWASSLPDRAHPAALHMKGGHTYYLSPRLGWFLNNDLWIFFGLLGTLFLITFLHRDQIERIR
jgi:hypothetical protein